MHYLLFTTTRCPKCPSFKEYVSKFVKIPGRILDETADDFTSLTGQFGIAGVPSILIFSDEGETSSSLLFTTSEVSELYTFFQAKTETSE